MKNKIFIVLVLSLVMFFVILLIAQKEGYYQSRNEKAKILTEKQIKEFEKDIENGKDIDVKKYVLYEDKDYTNVATDEIYKVSLKLENVIDKSIKIIFNKTSKLVSD